MKTQLGGQGKKKQTEGTGEEEDEESDEEAEDDEIHGVFSLDPSEREALEKSSVRKFVIPKINFKAETYPDLIDWEGASFSEPPLTASLSENEVRDLVLNPLIIPFFTCHTQPVERAIRLVTEAAGSVIRPEAREGFIRQRMRSRKEVARCDSKKDFFPKLENQ